VYKDLDKETANKKKGLKASAEKHKQAAESNMTMW